MLRGVNSLDAEQAVLQAAQASTLILVDMFEAASKSCRGQVSLASLM